MSKVRDAIARAGKRVREAKAETKETLAVAGTAAAIGYMERSGNLDSIPKLFGLPRTATLAGVAFLGEKYAPASMKPVLGGVKNGALAIAAYQFAKELDVTRMSGSSHDDLAAAERLERNLERRRRAELPAATTDDRELAELERMPGHVRHA